MAIELITGKAGTPHIDSADVGAYQAYTVGDGVYILNGMEAVIATANSVTVNAGDAMGEGRHFRITGESVTLPIGSGQAGYKRNDIIAAKYERDGSGIETVSLVVVPGTPATANQADPSMPSTGSVLAGATVAYWPLYRVTVDGLAPQAPLQLARLNPSNYDNMVATGTTNGWEWTKYASGRCEMSKAFTVTNAKVDYQENGWYVANVVTGDNLPFAVSERTFQNVSYVPNSSSPVAFAVKLNASESTTNFGYAGLIAMAKVTTSGKMYCRLEGKYANA